MVAKENGEPQQHTLRSADSTVPPLTQPEKAYFGRIATRTTLILKKKIREGKLKPQRSGKRSGHVNKTAIVMVMLICVFSVAIVYAQYRGQLIAQTSIRSPIVVTNQQFQLPDIWVNKSSSYIIDNSFIIDTNNLPITYTFLIYAQVTINGTQTQDMSKLFYNFNVVISDYSKNVTSVNLISAPQPVSFAYQNSADQQFRIIIQYSSKPVQLGASSSPLVISFAYSYSGE